MPVEDEASEPKSHSTPTLDDLYGSLSFREKLRLFRYGIRVDLALDEIDIHAGHFNARLRRAVKIMGMLETEFVERAVQARGVEFGATEDAVDVAALALDQLDHAGRRRSQHVRLGGGECPSGLRHRPASL